MRILRRERGQSAVEFALCATVFFMIVFGLLKVAVIYGDYTALQHAARDGARKGSVTRGTGDADPAAVTAAVTAAVKSSNALLDQDPTKLQIFVTGLDSNIGPDGTLWEAHDRVQVQVTYPWKLDVIGVTVLSGTMSSTTQAIIE
ncbi:MAG: TadE-like protein [Gaiellales bacterium]|jgi:Flp pilus assembly protein TadG|nr:TadE-like protein [Gaiellales bacterium]MDX6598296.1 TadE-like protein [Gaiellales bacterium]